MEWLNTIASDQTVHMPSSNMSYKLPSSKSMRLFCELRFLPSPPPSTARRSARLAALHARLSLSSRFPIESLGRCLIDPTADPNPHFNNQNLSALGDDLLGYYTSELVLCRYPRLPLAVIFAAMWAYCGPKTLAIITKEWGVDVAAEPGGEVDPGLLQCRRFTPGNADIDGTGNLFKNDEGTSIKVEPSTPAPGARKYALQETWRKTVSSATVYDDYFGEFSAGAEKMELDENGTPRKGTTLEQASTNFIRALVGAVYLHGGRPAAKTFFQAHFASRQLDVSKMFDFRQPTRDLYRLCMREGLTSPIARMLSETGRNSRHPVFTVGVFSGRDKLGEGTGSSLDEARIRAAVNALKGWYLYSPMEVRVPSEVEDNASLRPWTPVLIDGGEVIV
ncbi:hypothetical protein MMC25_002914 [Agyrium rufum]|nr:hypothetical protein [Agyrium rufum]